MKLLTLFGEIDSEEWKQEWLDMPEFIQEDKEPIQRIVLNFEFYEDVKKFSELIGQNITPRTNSLWYPRQDRIEPKNFLYVNENEKSKNA